jgi:hypothetical protein
MTTRAPQMLLNTMHAWEDLYPSAVFAGIVGDTNHPDGYHISYEDNSKSNYSTTRPPDKPPKMPKANEEMASAGDMSMNKTDMVKHYNLIIKVYNDKSDPRRKYFNAVNCWDGKSANAVRLDLYANTKSTATNDHMSHVHDEYPRMYCQDPMAGKAHLSVWSGESKEDWENDVGQVEGFTSDGFKDMMNTDNAIPNLPWRTDYVKFDAPDGAVGPTGGTNRYIMWETWFYEMGQETMRQREEQAKQAAALARIEAAIAAGPLPQPVQGTLTGPVVFTPKL